MPHSGKPFRVALVSPKGPLYRSRGGIFKKSLRYKPLTLTTLAALIPRELGCSVALYDEGIDELPDDIDADLIGLTVITGTSARAYELSKRFRAQGKTTVLGGPHVTLVPEDAQPHADSIVVGYAEESWPRLLHDFAVGRIAPRYDQAPGLSLADRPFAMRDLLPSGNYITDNVFEATRGCVHDCEFCVVPSAWGRKPYQKPIEQVIGDIRQHLERRRSKKLIFVDLNLIADRAYARELFAALEPLKVRWYGLATTLIGRDDELLESAARSGCAGLLIGFESISQANLKQTRKGFNRPEDFMSLVGKLHKYGIAVQGCFTFGLDEDEPDVFERTARFAVDAAIDLPRFAIVTPFPGTALFKRLESEGRILTRDYTLYDGQHVVFKPKRMTEAQLQFGTEAAWKLAYSWTSIARRLWRSPAPLPIGIGTNLGYRFYAHNLSRFYNCDWIISGPMTRQVQTIPLTAKGAQVG